MTIITKTDLSEYAKYDTSDIEDSYFEFIVNATLDWANKMTNNTYSSENFTQSFKLLCLILVGEIFRPSRRLGTEASQLNLEGVSVAYLQLSTKDNIKRLIEVNTNSPILA